MAVEVRVVVPTGKKLPAGTPLRLVLTAQLSLTLAPARVASLMNTPQEVAPAPVLAVTAGGAAMVGRVSSTTVTLAEQELDSSWLSVTVSVTEVEPSA